MSLIVAREGRHHLASKAGVRAIPESLADSARAQLREWWLSGLFVGELEREFDPAVAGSPVGSVDDLQDRPTVLASLPGDRVLSDAAREVVHLLREAVV